MEKKVEKEGGRGRGGRGIVWGKARAEAEAGEGKSCCLAAWLDSAGNPLFPE
jgi:hypothetical protein